VKKKQVMADIIDWMFKELWNTPKDKFEWNAILKKAHDMQKEHNRNRKGYKLNVVELSEQT
jgi:hypothetical protein